jgi:hypothetical protein
MSVISQNASVRELSKVHFPYKRRPTRYKCLGAVVIEITVGDALAPLNMGSGDGPCYVSKELALDKGGEPCGAEAVRGPRGGRGPERWNRSKKNTRNRAIISDEALHISKNITSKTAIEKPQKSR